MTNKWILLKLPGHVQPLFDSTFFFHIRYVGTSVASQYIKAPLMINGNHKETLSTSFQCQPVCKFLEAYRAKKITEFAQPLLRNFKQLLHVPRSQPDKTKAEFAQDQSSKHSERQCLNC